MNRLTRFENRWNPFKEMEDLHSRLSTLLGGALGKLPLKKDTQDQEQVAVAEWAPLVDITEDDHEYLIKAELPEVKKEELSVTVEDGVLTLTGERKFEKEEKSKKYHRI